MNFLRSFFGQVSSLTGPIGRYVRYRWLRTLIWCVAAAVVILIYGDMLRFARFAPFESERNRLVAVLLLAVGWATYNLVLLVRDRRKNTAMIAAMTAEQQADHDNLPAQEVEQIRQRLQEAMTQMRKVAGGRRDYVYRLPWYVMLGPPGSGKTTALINSGLNLPFADKLGHEPLRGVGGTRNCDWWFTEDAILLDSAGRYTTQDSDPELDRKGWQGFLALLKQYRPLQPINGVLVALSLEDLAARDPQHRLAHAQAIRRRLMELTEFFGVRFPVYFVLTKADLLAGFVEFFDSFSRTDREQVWGMTFPLDDGRETSTPAIQQFGTEFDLLLRRLNSLLLERMQQETDVERRGLIYGFPVQMATLKEVIQETLAEVFTTSRFEKRPLLRRRLFRVLDPERRADRPHDARDGRGARRRDTAAADVQRQREKLFPDATAAVGDLRRGQPRRRRSARPQAHPEHPQHRAGCGDRHPGGAVRRLGLGVRPEPASGDARQPADRRLRPRRGAAGRHAGVGRRFPQGRATARPAARRTVEPARAECRLPAAWRPGPDRQAGLAIRCRLRTGAERAAAAAGADVSCRSRSRRGSRSRIS